MVYITAPGNGQIAASCIIEVTQIPLCELLGGDDTPAGAERANKLIQSLFSRYVEGISRHQANGDTSVELLFHSVRVSNQTYEAQVKIYMIFRILGRADEENGIRARITDLESALSNDLKTNGYSLAPFETESQYHELLHSLTQIDPANAVAIGRKEKLLPTTLIPSKLIYFNPVSLPSENERLVTLTNVLSRYPDSMVSLQIIPTAFTQNEQLFVEQMKALINGYLASIRFQTGPRIDQTLEQLRDSYNWYSAASHSAGFLFQFIIVSDAAGTQHMSNCLLSMMESEERG